MIKKEKYIVLVKNLILKASVGIYPKEKIRKQKVRFNISITANDNIKTKNDISEFVSYEDVIKNVKNIINRGHIPLIENLAQNIAEKCLINKRILKIEIMIEKLETFKEAESVGIKIIRMNKK
jgi:dihydroneopterin aldolase|tara:strand:- start:68 stop:436 length:369 start_codon:yes stop_codon:yes gene_type:complete